MFTPEQLQAISFGKKFGGGYNPEDVDKVLTPLTADYISLYNENLSMRSKMRVLVTKLEEYRNAEASMKQAVINTQKTCDAMISDTKAKCTSMVRDAKAAAAKADALIAIEEARVESARQMAARQIMDLQDQLESCLHLLSEIRENHRPTGPVETHISQDDAAAVADEIAANVEALVGASEAPAATQNMTAMDDASQDEMFADLQFGRNYDPNKK